MPGSAVVERKQKGAAHRPACEPCVRKPRGDLVIDRSEIAANWKYLLLCFLGVGLSVPTIPLFGWGLFMGDVAKSFGWSLATVSSGLTFLTFSMALVGPVVGYIIDHYGAYWVVLLSTPVTFAALACLAFVDGSVVRYDVLWVVVGAFGMGNSPIVWTRLISERSQKSRGLALGIVSAGTAAFLLLAKPLVHLAIEHWGWRAGLVVLGSLPLVTVYPLAVLLLRPRTSRELPRESAAQPAIVDSGYLLGEAIRQWRFFIMIVVSLLIACLAGIIPHLENIVMLTGTSRSMAVFMTVTMGIALLFGRLIAGFLSDRVWAPGLFALFMIVGAASMLGLIAAGPSIPLLFLCVSLVGLTSGGEFQLLAYVTAKYFGLRSYGALFGIFWSLTMSGGGVWSLMIGRGVDRSASYAGPLMACAAALTLAAPLLCCLAQPPNWARVGATT
jgi:MFS family permease